MLRGPDSNWILGKLLRQVGRMGRGEARRSEASPLENCLISSNWIWHGILTEDDHLAIWPLFVLVHCNSIGSYDIPIAAILMYIYDCVCVCVHWKCFLLLLLLCSWLAKIALISIIALHLDSTFVVNFQQLRRQHIQLHVYVPPSLGLSYVLFTP